MRVGVMEKDFGWYIKTISEDLWRTEVETKHGHDLDGARVEYDPARHGFHAYDTYITNA